MAKKKTTKKKTSRFRDRVKRKDIKGSVKSKSCGGCSYFLAFIGAAVYYISTATGFWNGVWGFIKALLWPAFLVFELLKFLGMQ